MAPPEKERTRTRRVYHGISLPIFLIYLNIKINQETRESGLYGNKKPSDEEQRI